MTKRTHIIAMWLERNEDAISGAVSSLACAALILCALAGMMKPDAVTGRSAPVVLEAVR